MIYDLAIVGGGLAGHIARAEATRLGAQVAHLSFGSGMTALGSGVLDLAYTSALAPSRAPQAGLLDHLEDVARHEPGHLFATLGTSESVRTITCGHARLTELLGMADLPVTPLNWAAPPQLWPASFGGLYPAAGQIGRSAPAPREGQWAVVEWEGDTSMRASRVARALTHDAAASETAAVFTPVLCRDPTFVAGTSPLLTAARLDRPGEAERLASQVATALAASKNAFQGVVLPPLLGLKRHAAVLQALTSHLDLPVVEALGQLPSARGLRLQWALQAAQPIPVEWSQPVMELTEKNGRLCAATLADGTRVEAHTFILATGRAVGGGIVAPPVGRPHESLMHLALTDSAGGALFGGYETTSAPSLWQPQRLLEAAVTVDSTMRPHPDEPKGGDNLFVAGDLLAGHPATATRLATADGVTLASAVVAAQHAVQLVGQRGAS